MDAPGSPGEPLGIGERLRNAREARGLTLATAETLTRIRAVYLQALEEEAFDRLPGRMYARGFLRTYAKVLGLNPDELIQAYPQAFTVPAQPILGSHSVDIPIHPAAPPSRTRRILMYVGSALLLAVAILGIIGYQQLREFTATPPADTSRPPAPVAESGRPSVPRGQAETAPQPPGGAAMEQAVEVIVQARGTSWLLVRADNAEVFKGFVQPGDVRVFRGRDQLTVRIGNSTAVSLLVNGQAVRPDPRRRVWEETFRAP